VLEKTKSDFQDILFIDTVDFGRCLLIDDVVQTAETDHEVYDKAILQSLRKEDKNILILGGGDGYVSEMALKINPDLKIKVIELDAKVVDGCEKYLDQKIFKDPRVELHIEDAFKYLKDCAERGENFDGVVCDLTDEPIREEELKNFKDFYERIAALSNGAISEGGWFSVQAGAAKVTGEHMDAVSILEKILENDFENITRKDVLIPSFGEENAFLYGRKK
jgi:spermidine synthase